MTATPTRTRCALVSSSKPAHGSASAPRSARACTRPRGYQGSDAFTYTVRDPDGLEATAKVSVDVTTAPARRTCCPARPRRNAPGHGRHRPRARQRHGTGSTSPSHRPGSTDVACEADGTCVYTPDAGYSGNDGFSYTVGERGDGDQRSADIGSRSPPSAAGYGVKVARRAGRGRASVVQGQAASWGPAVAPAPAGVSDEALAALPPPGGDRRARGAHALKPSSVRTARGWTAEPAAAGARTLHAKAGSDALLGEVVRRDPAAAAGHRARAPAATGTSPILVGSKVFAFFHHSNPTQVTCVDRRDRQPLPRLSRRRSTRRRRTSPAPRRWSARGSTSTSSPTQFARAADGARALLLGRREGPHLRPDRRRPAGERQTRTPPRPC